MRAKLADIQAFVAGTHEKAIDRQSRFVTKRGKRIARIVPETDAVEARRNDPAYQALCEVLDRPLPLGGRDCTREDLHERHG